MLSILVLILMLVLYRRHRPWSLFLFFISASNGYNVIPAGSGMFKIEDMALIYIFLVLGYHIIIKDASFFRTDNISKKIGWLLLFLVGVTFFSWIYYGVPLLMVLQMVRFHLYILGYFLLRNQEYNDLLKTFKLLGTLTFICAILYILQIPLNRFLLLNYSENNEQSSDYGGFARFTNMPIYANLFLYVSFFTGMSFTIWTIRKKYLSPIVYTVMRLLTFGRTAILTTLSALLIGVCWKRKKLIKWVIVGGVLLLPLIGLIGISFSNRGTGGDLSGIMQGEYKNYTTGYRGEGQETTLLYRIAWVYERAKYLAGRPFIEQLMGMPYVSDSSPLIQKYNHFRVLDYGGKNDMQILRSYDIAWGNLVTQFGILGSVVLLSLWVSLGVYFYRHRDNPLAFAAFIYFLSFFMGSIGGMAFTALKEILPFFLLYLLIKKDPSMYN